MASVEHYDYLIIGGGPAGLQAGYHLERAGQDYLILEGSEEPGAFFQTHPRHRKLISTNKVHTGYEDDEINLRWDWNSILTEAEESHRFSDYSKRYFPDADVMVDYLQGYARRFNLNLRTSAPVAEIRRDEHFHVTLKSGQHLTARVLIVATGLSLPWLPEIPGIEQADTYCDMSLDLEQFNNKRVLILGKGNSGFETADALVEHAATIHVSSPHPLKMAWSTHYVGHLRAVNNNLLDTYQLKSQNAILDAEIDGIEKQEDGTFRVTFGYQHAEGEQEVLIYDHVIACTGFRFDTTIFNDSCRPQLCRRGKLPVQKSDWESVNVPDLYFAGTLMQYRDYRKYMSGFIHGFRYNVRTLCHLLLEHYQNRAFPSHSLPLCPDKLTQALIERINKTSALWQQPGFLSDVLVLDPQDGSVQWYEEMAVDYAHGRWRESSREYLLLTLEFGPEKFANPFNIPRIARDNVMRAEDSKFLHPIVRRFRAGEKLSEHHVIEDLAAEWREPEHIEPLREYLHEQLLPSSPVTFESAEAAS